MIEEGTYGNFWPCDEADKCPEFISIEHTADGCTRNQELESRTNNLTFLV